MTASQSGGQGWLAEFTATEFEQRWQRARGGMAAHGLSALLVTSETNYRYLAGHVTPFWVSRSRPFVLLLPLRGQPCLIVAASQRPTALATSFIADIRTYDGFVGAAVNLVEEALHEHRLAGGRIGCELGEEQRLGLPFADFVDLQTRLPGAAFVDAADLLWSLRLVKSPAEIDYLRQAAVIADRAYAEVFAAVRPGLTEREIFAAFGASCLRQGAERPGYVVLHAGAAHYRRISGPPTNRPLANGDLLWMDGGSVVHGYWSDFARMVAIGRPTAAQLTAYQTVRAIMHDGLAAVRPGQTAAALFERARRAFAAADLPLAAHGRVGHGLGLDITEPPSLNAASDAVLQPGMVLTIEPTLAREDGFFQLEENYVVTETGYELLTKPAPADLPVIA